MEKTCPGWKGHLPTRGAMGEPMFHKIPFKTCGTVAKKVRSATRAARLALPCLNTNSSALRALIVSSERVFKWF